MRHHLRDDLFAIVILALLGFSIYLDVTWRPFEAVFTWPALVTWLEDAAITAFIVWYFRDHVGKNVTAWWHMHHAPHLQSSLVDQNLQIQAQLNDQTIQIEDGLAVIRDNHFHHLREEVVELRAELAELRRRLLDDD